jgi:AcrR family transcriptional regulator
MNRRITSSRETRALILKTAKKLFLKYGATKCTIRGIAKKAGVSPASVMVHFKTKNALLEAALYAEIEAALIAALASLKPESDILEKFMHISRPMFTLYDSNRNLYRQLVGNMVIQHLEHTPNLSRQLDQYLTLLSEMVEEDKRAGRLQPQIDAVVCAQTLAALYFGNLFNWFRQPEMPVASALELMEGMARQLMDGIRMPSNS